MIEFFYKQINNKRFLEEIKNLDLSKCLISVEFKIDYYPRIAMIIDFNFNDVYYKIAEPIYFECNSKDENKKIQLAEQRLQKALKEIFNFEFDPHKKNANYYLEFISETSSKMDKDASPKIYYRCYWIKKLS